ncbi:uncharacterized protein LOC133717246 isoform X3 [Rosa rugosa]|nr:uncharacterized protein LOC133717246 isoform X3 [Rosa rugosa]
MLHLWQKLEEENAEFFKAYHLRLKLKDQIHMYNRLLEQQYHLMKQQERAEFKIAPVQNGMRHMPGYPEINSMGTISSCHGVNGIPAPGNFHSMQHKCVKERSPANTVPFFPAGDMKLDGASSPVAVALNGQFSFTPETSGLNLDTPVLDSAFTSDIANLERLRLGADGQNTCPEESLQSSDQMTWDFGFSNTAEWSNFQEFGPAGNYSGSEFQPSQLDINLDSAEQNDMVDGFLLDGPPGQGTQPAEETKPK